MEKKDIELIEKHLSEDDELKNEVEQHREYELILEDLNKRAYLTPEEEVELKRIKKLKLKGRDKIEDILSKYRDMETA